MQEVLAGCTIQDPTDMLVECSLKRFILSMNIDYANTEALIRSEIPIGPIAENEVVWGEFRYQYGQIQYYKDSFENKSAVRAVSARY